MAKAHIHEEEALGEKYTEELMPVSKLESDPRIQRPLDFNKVIRMSRDYDPNALGVITVSRRKNHGLVIVDGQHRVEVTRRVIGPDAVVHCHVYEGLTLTQEAELFLVLNNTTQPRIIDKFRVRITAEDEDAVQISSILNSYNWTIGNQVRNGEVNAIAAVERVYKYSQKVEAEPNLVQATIMVITRAWGQDRYGVQGPVFEGIGRLIGEHGSLLDLDVLIQRLKNYPGGPYALHNESTQYAHLKKLRAPMAVAEILTETYNKGRRVNTIPSWRKRA